MENNSHIPFNKPFMTGNELAYIGQAYNNGHLAGDGEFTIKCNEWLEDKVTCKKALLTHSCTAALEMAAILSDIQRDDEVIMPSFTFVSTANAFVLRGGIPVFVDIRSDTLNIDESLIEAAITRRTKAIVVVHYAGVACEMDTIMRIARKYNLIVIEDAAQALLSTYKGRPLGSFGHLATISFHETKNIISGEGGALLINDEDLVSRAEIIREKGTNRSNFFRGMVDKYTWVDTGSSFLPGEVIAAFLWAQLQQADEITDRRQLIWKRYHDLFDASALHNYLITPEIPDHCQHNAHMFHLRVHDTQTRDNLLHDLKVNGIGAVFHYIPLHSSPKGREVGRCASQMDITDKASETLVRLPFWLGIEPHIDRIGTCLLDKLDSLIQTDNNHVRYG